MRKAVGGVVLAVVQGKEADSEVVRLACRLAQERGAALRGLYVVEVPQARELSSWHEGPDEERAQAALFAATEEARDAGCSLLADVLPAREAGQAIVDEVVEWAVDVVVLATPHPSRRGDAALHVLEKAPSTVVVIRLARGGQTR